MPYLIVIVTVFFAKISQRPLFETNGDKIKDRWVCHTLRNYFHVKRLHNLDTKDDGTLVWFGVSEIGNSHQEDCMHDRFNVQQTMLVHTTTLYGYSWDCNPPIPNPMLRKSGYRCPKDSKFSHKIGLQFRLYLYRECNKSFEIFKSTFKK